MKTELDILKDVAGKLSSINVSYMLTGSLAMMYYAQPRMTRDIDIVIELNKFQIENFIRLFENEYYLAPEAIKDSVETFFIFNLIHRDSLVKIDFVIRKPEEYRLVEFNRREKIIFSGIDLYIVSKEDLILSKLNWAKESNSDLQIRDIKSLLNTGYDEVYLSGWAKKLNLYNFFMSLEDE
jgi:hypothetical protein